MIQHIFGLLTQPVKQWQKLHDSNPSMLQVILPVLLLAAIPPVAGYIGTTTKGWSIGAGDPVKLAADNALILAILYYLAILAAIFSVALMIRWMGQTYGADQPLSRCVTLAVFIPVPLLLIGIMQLYPVLWLNLIVALPALAYTILLLYTGIPVMMEIPKERGFLFSTAVLGFGMVGLVGMLVVTVFLWGIGLEPVFA